jgi:hypothetical protein
MGEEYSVEWFRFLVENNDKWLGEQARRLWEHYTALEARIEELKSIGILEQRALHFGWTVEEFHDVDKRLAALEAENKGLHIEAREQVALIHDEQAKVAALEAKLERLRVAAQWVIDRISSGGDMAGIKSYLFAVLALDAIDPAEIDATLQGRVKLDEKESEV